MRRNKHWKAYRTLMWFMHGNELAAHKQWMREVRELNCFETIRQF